MLLGRWRMRRVMGVGQPGAGKSWLALRIGARRCCLCIIWIRSCGAPVGWSGDVRRGLPDVLPWWPGRRGSSRAISALPVGTGPCGRIKLCGWICR